MISKVEIIWTVINYEKNSSSSPSPKIKIHSNFYHHHRMHSDVNSKIEIYSNFESFLLFVLFSFIYPLILWNLFVHIRTNTDFSKTKTFNQTLLIAKKCIEIAETRLQRNERLKICRVQSLESKFIEKESPPLRYLSCPIKPYSKQPLKNRRTGEHIHGTSWSGCSIIIALKGLFVRETSGSAAGNILRPRYFLKPSDCLRWSGSDYSRSSPLK